MAQFHVIAGDDTRSIKPVVNHIEMSDVGTALAAGIKDFAAFPTYTVFLVLLYPIAGFCIAALASGVDAFALLYPLMSGFALLGPLAAILIYQISRRREQGKPAGWADVRAVFTSPALPSIIALGALLVVVFVVWIAVAQAIADMTIGHIETSSYLAYLRTIVTTPQGWTLIIVGNIVGLCFALVTLGISAISFPLMLDQDVGAAAAIQTSFRAVWNNAVPMLAFGALAAASIVIGFAFFFVGLAVTLPVMGHATWHLYRRIVSPTPA